MESFLYFFNRYCFCLSPYSWPSFRPWKKEEVASDFYQFLYLSLGLSIFLFVLVFLVAPLVLNNMGLEVTVANIAVRYLWFLAIGDYSSPTL